MVGLSNPLGKLQPAAAIDNRTLIVAGKHFGEAPRHDGAQAIIPSADVDAHIVNPSV
jgi:hypothetical protein